jgi:hypothetical protein
MNKGIAIMEYAAERGNTKLVKALVSKNVPLHSMSEELG